MVPSGVPSPGDSNATRTDAPASAALPSVTAPGTSVPASATLATAALLLAVFSASLWPSLVSLNDRWIMFDAAYSHGYLVLAMVGYFLWLQRDRLQRIEPRPAPAWAVALAGLAVAWALSMIVDVELGGMMLLPPMLLGIVLVTRGWETARLAAFPLLLLYVAIPMWEDFLSLPLRDATTGVSAAFLLAFAPFPVHVEGYAIHVPDGTFFVADACSGLAFFLTGLTIGLAYGYLNIEGFARRAAFLVICVVLSIVSNWVRVTSLVYIGHYTSMESSLITEGHLTYGWFLFAAVMMLMLWIGYRMSAPLPEGGDTTAAPAMPGFSPVAVTAALLATLLAPALAWGYRQVEHDAVPMPALPASFEATDPGLLAWRGFFHGTPRFAAGMLREDPALGLLYVHYDRQTQGNEVVSDENRLANEDTWTLTNQRRLATAQQASLPHPVTESELRSNGGSGLLVWHWNAVGGRPATGRLASKLSQLQATLLDGRTDGTFVALTLQCASSCDAARERMRSLAPPHVPEIGKALADAR